MSANIQRNVQTHIVFGIIIIRFYSSANSRPGTVTRCNLVATKLHATKLQLGCNIGFAATRLQVVCSHGATLLHATKLHRMTVPIADQCALQAM